MAFNPLSGKNASVTIGMVTYAFDSWKATMSDGLPKVTNFTGGGKAQFVSGVQECEVTLSGPYDEGNQGFTLGTQYTLILGYTSMVNLTVPAILKKIEPDAKVEDAIRISLLFMVTGAFTAAII